MILAAGEGRRFRGADEVKRRAGAANKLLLTLGQTTLLQRVIDCAAGSHAMSCTLVLGDDARSVLVTVDARRCVVIANPRWQEGIAASIRAGLNCHRDDDACIFVLADQPFVSTADLDLLIASHLAERAAIIALRAGEVWGAPVLFPRQDFAALLALRGDAGAKRHAMRHMHRLRFESARSTSAFVDVDTRADYERIRDVDAHADIATAHHKDPRT